MHGGTNEGKEMTYSTNKWVGLDIGGGSQYLNAAMYAYLQKNGWGLWLEGVEWNSGGSTNNQSTVISWIQSNLEQYLMAAQSYGIPVRIDAKDYANSYQGTLSWCASNYNQIFAYYANWVNGTKGNCLKQFWYEGQQTSPAMLQYMHQSAPTGVQVVWAWNASWNITNAQFAALFPFADIVDIEMWWVDDTAITLPIVQWILTNYPTKPIGVDTQPSGGWPDQFHLWGAVWNGTDAEPTYAVQRTRCQTAVNAVRAALGRPFDSLTAEVAGDSGDIGQAAHTAPNGTVYPQGGWTEVQIMTEQLDFFDAQNWEKPVGGGNTTTYLASTSNPASVAVTAAPVATQLTAVASVSTVNTGTAFTISGVLTAAGAGLANQTVQLQKNGVNVTGATATTSSTGAYSISVTETTAGTYAYVTTYAGGSV